MAEVDEQQADAEWVGRWGLQRGIYAGEHHLTLVEGKDAPTPDLVLTYNEPTPGAPASCRIGSRTPLEGCTHRVNPSG